jgi:ribonuclease Z
MKRLASLSLILCTSLLSSRTYAGNSEGSALLNRSVRKNIEERAKRAKELQRLDAVTTILCGVGSPMTQAGSQSCTAIFVGGQFLLFDAGDGARSAMNQLNLPLDELDAVFITHFHNDHFADLGEVIEFSWMNGRRKNLPVIGPEGMNEIVKGFSKIYSLDQHYRNGHHGDELMPLKSAGATSFEFKIGDDSDGVVVFDQEEVRVKAFRVNHPPVVPSVGYRIEHMGKVIVVSGDTISDSVLLKNSNGADLLIAEVMNKDAVAGMGEASRRAGNELQAKILYDIQSYHMDVKDVALLAKNANVKHLVLNHLAPSPDSWLIKNRLFHAPVRKIYKGKLDVGEFGSEFKLDVSVR